MLRRHAHLGRQVLQRQRTLIALAAQEGGDQGFHRGSVAQWRESRSYDRVNSFGILELSLAVGFSFATEV
jgi:hypothetical protein